MKVHVILYVASQDRSTAFYRAVLGAEPSLDVPGMTEFTLSDNTVLGLMPEDGIRRLLAPKLGVPAVGRGGYRAELYLVVDDPSVCHARALAAGADELSAVQPRDWGHTAGYSRDADGYILAFAGESARQPK